MAKKKVKVEVESVALEPAPDIAPVAITSIKGFDSDLKCRGFQFEVGKSYSVDGKIRACLNGFHAIPDNAHPLSVFSYYPPAGSRFAIVTQAGETDKDGDKISSAKITIGAEISLGDLAKRAIEWVSERAKWIDGPIATKNSEAATATGTQGAATASGYQGAATASGTQGAATASGDQGAAISTGPYGAVKGSLGCDLFAREFDGNGRRISIACGTVGHDGIKAGVWYVAKDGKLVPKG